MSLASPKGGAAPRVSVITPTHNRAALLPETIESVLDQRWPQLEYIVVDDGSTDGTDRVLARYSRWITVLTLPNGGEAAAVNRGFEASQGDLIVTVNSDDPLLPGYFETAVAFMREHQHMLAGYPDWKVIGADSMPTTEVRAQDFDYIRMLQDHQAAPGPAALMRRRALEITDGRNPRYRFVSDLDFWLRLGLHGPIARIPHTLATWRDHPGALSKSDRGDRMALEQTQVIEELFARPDLPDDIARLKAEAVSSAHYAAGVVLMDSTPSAARAHFFHAARLSPRTAFSGRRALLVLAGLLLPAPILEPARRVRRSVRRWLGSRGALETGITTTESARTSGS